MTMKEQAFEAVRHIHAQDAAWFFGFVLLVIFVVLWRDAWKEIREERKRKAEQDKQRN